MKQFEGSTNLWIASGRQPSRRCCIRALVKIAAHGLDEKNVGQSGNYFRRTCASVVQLPQHILCGQSKPLVRAVATGFYVEQRGKDSKKRIDGRIFKNHSATHQTSDWSSTSDKERGVLIARATFH